MLNAYVYVYAAYIFHSVTHICVYLNVYTDIKEMVCVAPETLNTEITLLKYTYVCVRQGGSLGVDMFTSNCQGSEQCKL